MPCGHGQYDSYTCSCYDLEKEGLSLIQDNGLGLDIKHTKDGNAKAAIRSVEQAYYNNKLCRDADGVVAYVVL